MREEKKSTPVPLAPLDANGNFRLDFSAVGDAANDEVFECRRTA